LEGCAQACAALASFLGLLFAFPALADEEPPRVGQPPNFSGAVGTSRFEVESQAEPTEVEPGQPIRYRVRIAGKGRVMRPPQRPDLRRDERFKAAFRIEDVPDDSRTWKASDGQVWEFAYRLRPRSAAVTHIPSLRFVYFRPGLVPREKGYFTTGSRAIELRVRSPEPIVESTAPIPDDIHRIVEGPAVLKSEQQAALRSVWVLAVLLLAPPALCGCWYAAWRRLYPDAARAARRRRSQAARTALRTLRAGRGEDAAARARRSSAVLDAYLRDRLDLPIADATPRQAGERLRRIGFPPHLTQQAAELIRSCDAVRFAPELLPPEQNLPALAENLILALESEPWLSPLS
jgi:hypothetical protein